MAFAIVAVGLVAARLATASCPPATVASGLPALPAAAPSAAAAPTGAVAPPLVDGKQVVNMTIQVPCYYPDCITVQSGVPVQLNVGAVGESGCGRQVLIRGLRINGVIPPGKIATLEFTPEQAGDYSISCGMGMMRAGILRVTE